MTDWGDPIAERRLVWTPPEADPREVVVRLWAPRRAPEGSRPEFIAKFEIVGLDEEMRVEGIGGVDGLQALMICFDGIFMLLKPYRERLKFLNEPGHGVLKFGHALTEESLLHLEGLMESHWEHDRSLLRERIYGSKAPHPGRVLKLEFLHPNMPGGPTVQALATSTGLPDSDLSGLVAGTKAVTADVAKRLGAALDTTARFWLDLQADYDLANLSH